MYKYLVKGYKDEYVIYFWQGRNSGRIDKGTSAMLTVDLHQHATSGSAVQVRVEQASFRIIFA